MQELLSLNQKVLKTPNNSSIIPDKNRKIHFTSQTKVDGPSTRKPSDKSQINISMNPEGKGYQK
jgi:hypothetical protein